MAFRSILYFVPATIFGAVMISTGIAGASHEKALISLSAVGMLTTLGVCRGRGVRCVEKGKGTQTALSKTCLRLRSIVLGTRALSINARHWLQ